MGNLNQHEAMLIKFYIIAIILGEPQHEAMLIKFYIIAITLGEPQPAGGNVDHSSFDTAIENQDFSRTFNENIKK